MQFDENALHEVRQSRLLIDRVDDWLFEEFEPYVGQRVLEIGCGLGNHLERLLNREFCSGWMSPRKVLHAYASGSQAMRMFGWCAAASLTRRFWNSQRRGSTPFSRERPGAHRRRRTGAAAHPSTASAGRQVHPGRAGSSESLRRDGSLHRTLSTVHQSEPAQANGRGWIYGAGRQVYQHARAAGWLINGRLLRRRVPPRGQLRLLNRIMPFARGVERVFPAAFGVSVLMVGQKP